MTFIPAYIVNYFVILYNRDIVGNHSFIISHEVMSVHDKNCLDTEIIFSYHLTNHQFSNMFFSGRFRKVTLYSFKQSHGKFNYDLNTTYQFLIISIRIVSLKQYQRHNLSSFIYRWEHNENNWINELQIDSYWIPYTAFIICLNINFNF